MSVTFEILIYETPVSHQRKTTTAQNKWKMCNTLKIIKFKQIFFWCIGVYEKLHMMCALGGHKYLRRNSCVIYCFNGMINVFMN